MNEKVNERVLSSKLLDDDGENQAVRMFLGLYGGQRGITAEQMREHLNMAGFDGAWPEWANTYNGHLTKAGAQLWIRHLFALEQPPQRKPWVGLTESEKEEATGWSVEDIEAKLMEKNT